MEPSKVPPDKSAETIELTDEETMDHSDADILSSHSVLTDGEGQDGEGLANSSILSDDSQSARNQPNFVLNLNDTSQPRPRRQRKPKKRKPLASLGSPIMEHPPTDNQSVTAELADETIKELTNLRNLIKSWNITPEQLALAESKLDHVNANFSRIIGNINNIMEEKITQAYKSEEFQKIIDQKVAEAIGKNPAFNKEVRIPQRKVIKAHTAPRTTQQQLNDFHTEQQTNLAIQTANSKLFANPFPALNKETSSNGEFETASTANKNISNVFNFTFSDATKRQIEIPTHIPNNLNKIIVSKRTQIIDGVDTPTTTDSVATILNKINPVVEKISFRYRSVLRSGEVAIQFSSNEDLLRFNAAVDRLNLPVKFDKKEPLNPYVTIANIEANTPVETIKDAIKSEFGQYPKNAYVFPPRNNKTLTSASIECTPDLWRKMTSGVKIQIGWLKCPIYNQERVRRCNKCKLFGHGNSRLNPCNNPAIILDPNDPNPQCPACKDFNEKQVKANKMFTPRSTDHAFNDKTCESYKFELRRTKLATDYRSPPIFTV